MSPLRIMFQFILSRHSRPTLFPYTTIFRSRRRSLTESVMGDETVEAALQRKVLDRNACRGEFQAMSLTRLLFEPTLLRSPLDRKSTRLKSSHTVISYAVFCWKKTT